MMNSDQDEGTQGLLIHGRSRQLVTATTTKKNAECRPRKRPLNDSNVGESVAVETNGFAETHTAPWSLQWQTEPSQGKFAKAVIQTRQSCTIAVRGRGSFKLLHGGDATVNGYVLHPYEKQQKDHIVDYSIELNSHDDGDDGCVPFDCPPWASWCRIELSQNAVLEVQCTKYNACLLRVRSAHDTPRCTVFPASWVSTVETIKTDSLNFGKRRFERTAWFHRTSFEEESENDGEDASGSATIMNNHFIVAFAGAKGVGKSTCLRYCLNRLLSLPTQQVAVLDADVGQPELGPPGMLTLSIRSKPLLQQPHSHFLCTKESEDQNYVEAYFFGATSSQSNPERYIECIRLLMEAYKTSVDSSIPLLVNLDGWVKGLGLEVLNTLLQSIIRPLHIVKIMGTLKSHMFDLQLDPQHVTIHECVSFNVKPEDVALPGPPNADHSSSQEIHNNGNTQALETAETFVDMEAFERGSENGDSRAESGAALSRIDVAVEKTASIEEPCEDIMEEDVANNDVAEDARDAEFVYDSQTTTCDQPLHASSSTSISLPAVALRSLRLLAYFLPCNDDANESPQHIWDRSGVGQTYQNGFLSESDVFAQLLASARPYVVPMESVDYSWTTSDLAINLGLGNCDSQQLAHMRESRFWDALNGSVVGLCVRNGEVAVPTSTICQASTICPCVGLGVVRSIDRVRRMLYILTPVVPSKLETVDVLCLASNTLTLPIDCTFRGVYGESYPWSTFERDEKGTTVIGADPMKSRNSIGRRALQANKPR